jgi:hypothetical protein
MLADEIKEAMGGAEGHIDHSKDFLFLCCMCDGMLLDVECMSCARTHLSRRLITEMKMKSYNRTKIYQINDYGLLLLSGEQGH